GDFAPAQPAELARGEPEKVASVEARDPVEPGAGRQQPQQGARQHGLAGAALADDAEALARRQRQADARHRPQESARGRQLDREALDLDERRRAHDGPCRGSVSARSVSPTRLKASTVRNMAAAGMKAICGAPSRLSRPSAIMLPQLGVGGGTPSPRKLRMPSATMVMAISSRK